MRILILTDAWYPQINGVVRTLDCVARELRAIGDEVEFITPELFHNCACPTYPEIRLAFAPPRRVAAMIADIAPDAVHIATEGPIGWAGRRACHTGWIDFTTSFHTRFPEYVNARCGLPVGLGYAVMRHFHNAARTTMVTTATLKDELARRGFARLSSWSHGVDASVFRPGPKDAIAGTRPLWLYVGRVAVEKNIAAFLDLPLDGTKIVVGDGPQIGRLRRQYPNVRFVGAKTGGELVTYYAAADVFVFPSQTDTFGNVLLEALACGVPVAAFPVPGPQDVINGHPVGVLDADLGIAARRALQIDPALCRAFALARTWRQSAMQFRENLVPAHCTLSPSERDGRPGISSSPDSSSSSGSTTGTA